MLRIRTLLSLTLAAAVLVAGCGGTGTTKEEPKAQTPASDSKPAPQPAAPKAPVKISFWHGMGYDSTHGKTVQALVKQYNESQKDVIVEEVYQGNYADLEKKVVAAIAASTPPTVIQLTDSMLISLVGSKAVQALDSVIPAAEKSDYPSGLFDSLTFDGKTYALPFNKSVVVLIYDKKLIPNPPKTWEEFEKVSQEITVKGQRFGNAFDPNVYSFGNFFIQAGGQWIKDGKANFNSPEGVKAMEYLVKMAQDGVAIYTKPREYTSNYFNEGRAAMIQSTSASFAYIKPTSGNPWGVALLPKGPNNAKTGLSGANVAMVSGIKADEAEAAMKFMLWLTGKDAQLKWGMEKTGYLPVRKSALATSQWKEFVKTNPEYEVAGQAILEATTHPNHPQWSNVQKVLTSAVEEALLGKATPRAALDKAAVEADKLLAKK